MGTANALCQLWGPLGASKDELVRVIGVAQDYAEVLDKSKASTTAAYVVANVVALLTCAWLSWRALGCFCRVQRLVRRGAARRMGAHRPFAPAQYKVAGANKFIGLHIGSIVFGYLIVLATCWLVLGFAFNPHVYAWVWNGGAIPAGVVIALVQVYALDRFVANRLLSDGYWIKHPRLWVCYSSMMVMASVVSGIAASIKRFFFLTAFSLVSVMTLDTTHFPEKLTALDSGYTAFMSLVMMRHRHRSPVLSTARDVRFGLGAQAPGGNKAAMSAEPAAADQAAAAAAAADPGVAPRTGAQRRARTRWHLAFTLLNNPQLIRDRGFAAEDEAVVEEETRQHASMPLSWAQAIANEVEGATDVVSMTGVVNAS